MLHIFFNVYLVDVQGVRGKLCIFQECSEFYDLFLALTGLLLVGQPMG